MGEAKRRKRSRIGEEWPLSDDFRGVIELHNLPPVPEIDGRRLRELTGYDQIPETAKLILRAFRAVVGDHTFHVGFCLGDGERFSATGLAVIQRLMMESPDSKLHVVPIAYEDIAWDIVLRHLRTFAGQTLLFAFPDSDVYDAGVGGVHFSPEIAFFNEGQQVRRLTAQDHRRIKAEKASILGRPQPPIFYALPDVEAEELPWIFQFTSPTGKTLRVTAWNGRRNYAHEFPTGIINWVGGHKIAIVQVDKPVGINRRSALGLTHFLSRDFDAVIHWARDTQTYQSIIQSFVKLDLPSVGPPKLPEGWTPEITMIGANGP